MKKTLLLLTLFTLPAHADVFFLPEKSDILYDNSYPLNEYLISDVQNDCVLNYLSADKIPDGYTAKIVNESYPDACLKKGFADVKLFDSNNQLIRSWQGYFTDGFFMGALPLNAKIVKRFSDKNETQYLFFLLDEDDDLQIRYLGLMHAVIQEDGLYDAFRTCYPFEITLQTSNRALFQNAETLKNLTSVVQNFAQTLCPLKTDIILQASDSPSLDPNSVYFTQYLKAIDKNLWIVQATTSYFDQNEQKPKQIAQENPQIPAENPATEDIEMQIKNSADELLARSTETGKPVVGEFIIHVSKKTKRKVVYADQPFLMKSLENPLHLTAGWYRVKASVQPMDDFEKKRSGIALTQKAAIIQIEAADVCDLPFCKESGQ